MKAEERGWVRVEVLMDPAVLAVVDRIAAETGYSRSTFIRNAVHRAYAASLRLAIDERRWFEIESMAGAIQRLADRSAAEVSEQRGVKVESEADLDADANHPR